jgi:hypothetical protein
MNSTAPSLPTPREVASELKDKGPGPMGSSAFSLPVGHK